MKKITRRAFSVLLLALLVIAGLTTYVLRPVRPVVDVAQHVDGQPRDHDDQNGDQNQRLFARQTDPFPVKFVFKRQLFKIIFHISIIHEKNCFHKQKYML